MKKILAVATFLTASAALADTTSCNSFGVLRVDSMEAQTIVAIPWVEASTNGSPISVANIVKTAGLTIGDELYAYENKEYKAWQLTEQGWVAANNVTLGGVDISGTAASKTLARGNAVLLVRQNPKDGENAVPFYLQGQVSTAAVGATTLPAGAWSLIAPPKVSATSLNDATWTTPDTKDRILFVDAKGDAKIAKYKDNVWKVKDLSDMQWKAELAVIPAGMGAWYQNVGTSDVTVNWN